MIRPTELTIPLAEGIKIDYDASGGSQEVALSTGGGTAYFSLDDALQLVEGIHYLLDITGHLAEQVDRAEESVDPPGAPDVPEPPLVRPNVAEGLCWRCQGIMVETKRGTFCPNGCPEWEDYVSEINDAAEREGTTPGTVAARLAEQGENEPEANEASGKGTMSAPYMSTRESPRPTAMPQGSIIPPTD